MEVEINTVINTHNYALLGDHARFIAKRYPDAVAVTMSFIAPTGFCVVSKKTIPKIRDVQPHLFEAIEVLAAAGICVMLPDRCGIPLCTVRGYEKHHEGLMTTPFAGHGRVSSDHTKFDGCERCVWNDRCIGYWKKCVDLHGGDEFVPVTQPVDVEPQPLPYRIASAEQVERFMEEERRRLAASSQDPG